MYGLKNDFGEAVQLSKAQKDMLITAARSTKGVFTGHLLPTREDVAAERTINKLEDLKLLAFNKRNSSWSNYSHTLTALGKDVVIHMLLELAPDPYAV